MKYFPINQTVENEIRIIKKEIYLSMNGICSEQMELRGVNYKQNFGVSWVRLKEIAQFHAQNIDLAERLWHMNIRETKLIATLLVPLEDMKIEHSEEWLKEINTKEVAEISAMTLFSKVPHSTSLIIEHISNPNILIKLTMIHSAARNVYKYSEIECTQILELITNEDLKNPQLLQCTNALLENIVMLKPSLSNIIAKRIKILSNSENTHCQYTYNNITELIGDRCE